jgi:exosortase
MEAGVRRVNWPVLAAVVAYAAVWLDYAGRLRDQQTWAHALAVAAGVLVLWRPSGEPRDSASARWTFGFALLCALIYACAYWELTAMLRCALALTGLWATLRWQRNSSRPWLGLALLLLGVPALSQVEELIGAPLRLTVAEAAAALLRSSGLSVEAEGTRLAWAGGAVDVDAPCSGLRMLWTGALVTLLASARFALSRPRALAFACAAPLLIWSGNVLRCAALFYVESGIVPAPSFAHVGVGLCVFTAVCAALWELARQLAKPRGEWAS